MNGADDADLTLDDLIGLYDDELGETIDIDLANRRFLPGDMPERGIDRLGGTIIARRYLTVFGGAGGSSKSTLMATTAISLATGLDLVGPDIAKPVRVLVLNFEDDQDMVDRLLAAAFKRHGVTREKLGDRLIAHGQDTIRRILRLSDLEPLCYLEETSGGDALMNHRVRDGLIDLIRRTGPDVVIIDPMAGLTGSVRITNEVMNAFSRDLITIARELDVAMVLLTHLNKVSQDDRRPKSATAIKHGGELVDASRVALIVDNEGGDQIRKWRDAYPQRGPYRDIKVARVVKTNIGPEKYRFWYRIEIEKVEAKNGDVETVPVAVPFDPPSMAEASTLNLYLRIESTLRNEFIKASWTGRQSAKVRNIKDVLAPMLKDIENVATIVATMKGEGLVAIKHEKNRAETGNSDAVQRLIPLRDPAEIRQIVKEHGGVKNADATSDERLSD